MGVPELIFCGIGTTTHHCVQLRAIHQKAGLYFNGSSGSQAKGVNDDNLGSGQAKVVARIGPYESARMVGLLWYWSGNAPGCAVVSHILKSRPLPQRNALEGLAFRLDGEKLCAFTGVSAQDEKFWYKRTLNQEEFIKADHVLLRSVERQDRLLRV